MEGIIELQKEPIIHDSRKPTEGALDCEERERRGEKEIHLLKWGRRLSLNGNGR